MTPIHNERQFMPVQTPPVLAEICATKASHVAACKEVTPLSTLKKLAEKSTAPRGFIKALRAKKSSGDYGLICEIKKASPSKGLIRADFNPKALAKDYETAGAACLSVLTDAPYFQGHDDYLVQVKNTVQLPVLRKDFMIDPYQIIQSRALGADCILLILSALDHAQAIEMEQIAHDYGMDVLIEVHDVREMDRALTMRSPLIGINNRNLKTMEVSTQNTLDLAPMTSADHICVAESGLKTHDDLLKCASRDVTTFLIGETFMRQDNIIRAVHNIQGL